MTTRPHLVIEELWVTRGGVAVLRNVSVDVAPGTIVALMGSSGAGKSTVLRACAALQPFDSGTIRIGDVHLEHGPLPRESALRELRRQVGMVFQSHALFEHLTALENVTLAPVHAHGVSVARATEAAAALLQSLGVGHRATALPRQLSGGEAQRVAIARSLALDPAVLLMDEPTAALDPARRGSLARALRELAEGGRGLLIATHDVEFALACATDVVILAAGLIAERGPARQVLEHPQSDAARDLLHHASATPAAP